MKIIGLLNQSAAYENLIYLLNDFSKVTKKMNRLDWDIEIVWPYSESPLRDKFDNLVMKISQEKFSVTIRKLMSETEEDLWMKENMNSIIIPQTPYLSSSFNIKIAGFLREANNVLYYNYGVLLWNDYISRNGIEFFEQFKLILTSFEDEATMFQNAGITKDKIYNIGNAFIDEIEKQRDKKKQLFPVTQNRIIWAPHWSMEWGSLHISSKILLEYFQSNRLMNLTIRPHPLLTALTNRTSLEVNREIVPDLQGVKYLTNLLKLPNVNISQNPLLSDIEQHSALITDGISIVVYWAMTKKPQLFIHDASSPSLSPIFSSVIAKHDSIYVESKSQPALATSIPDFINEHGNGWNKVKDMTKELFNSKRSSGEKLMEVLDSVYVLKQLPLNE
jgi:hypothetical protein